MTCLWSRSQDRDFYSRDITAVSDTCPDGHVLHWQFQPMIWGMAAGDLLLSAAVLLCGLTFTGIVNLADVFSLAIFSEWYFYRLQKE